MSKDRKTQIFITIATMAAFFLIMFMEMNSGIGYNYGEEALEIKTSLWDGYTAEYANVESVTIRDDIEIGEKVNGYVSVRLSLGSFNNAEFGDYTIYAYADCQTYVVAVMKDGTVLVLNGATDEETAAIYDKLTENLG